MEFIFLMSVFVSLVVVLLVLPMWIKKCKKVGLLWEDLNKPKHPKNVAASGGLIVVLGFVLGVLFYIAFRTFLEGSVNDINIGIFSLLAVVLMLSIVGLTDDLLGWKNGGLSRKLRVFLALISSIPLVVINAGTHVINFPFFGTVNFGILYPLFLIPFGIAGATTVYNFLAGFNGLEAGQGILILSFLSFVSYTTGNVWLAVTGMCMVFALIPFLVLNWNPASVFPGDALTYSVGALIAGMAILGNFEKIAAFVFIPYIVEMVLKARGGLTKNSFGIPNKKGNLKMPYKKIYGLTHLAIFVLGKFKKNVRENDVVYFIYSIQILFILAAFLMWFL